MDILTIFFFIVGLVLLIYGAQHLINGASRLATLFGIPPLLVGLTIVAFGTSAPELAASLQASYRGNPGIALGNVVGSNIFNVLCVLGVTAIIAPIAVNSQVIKRDLPIMIGLSVLMWVLSLDNMLGRIDGIILVCLFIGYLVFIFRATEDKSSFLPDNDDRPRESKETVTPQRTGLLRKTLENSVLIIVGLAMLVLGARWLVESSVELARALNVSELIIGLTVIAIGTSLPELSTSIIAGMRGKGDIAVGNVIGSSIFNIVTVIGGTAAISPNGIKVVDGALGFDFPIMLGVAVMTIPIFYTGLRISRLEGSLFLAYYVLYAVGLFLIVKNHENLSTYAKVIFWFVIPLTVLTLGFFFVRALIARHRSQ